MPNTLFPRLSVRQGYSIVWMVLVLELVLMLRIKSWLELSEGLGCKPLYCCIIAVAPNVFLTLLETTADLKH